MAHEEAHVERWNAKALASPNPHARDPAAQMGGLESQKEP